MANSKFNFGRSIKFFLREKKMTQIALAEKSGFSQNYIHDLANGNKLNPEVDTINKIADALDISIVDFLFVSLETSKCRVQIQDEISKSLDKFEQYLNVVNQSIVSTKKKLSEKLQLEAV